jgi:hypothetical protein
MNKKGVIKMKKDNCHSCRCEIDVLESYKPEFCCDSYDCGCLGMSVNPIFCDECEKKILSQ